MAGTVSRVSGANSEDGLTEDTGRLINAHMTAKGEDAAIQTVITAENAMPTVTIDNLDVNRPAIDFDHDPKFELHSGLELLKVAAAVRSSGRLKKPGRSASLGCIKTRAPLKICRGRKKLIPFESPVQVIERVILWHLRLPDKQPVLNVATAFFFWKASLSIELPLTAHDPNHP